MESKLKDNIVEDKLPLLEERYRKILLSTTKRNFWETQQMEISFCEINEVSCLDLGINKVGALDIKNETAAIIDTHVNTLLIFSVNKRGQLNPKHTLNLGADSNCLKVNSLEGVKIEKKYIYVWSSHCFWVVSKISAEVVHHKCMSLFETEFAIISVYENTRGQVQLINQVNNKVYMFSIEGFNCDEVSTVSLKQNSAIIASNREATTLYKEGNLEFRHSPPKSGDILKLPLMASEVIVNLPNLVYIANHKEGYVILTKFEGHMWINIFELNNLGVVDRWAKWGVPSTLGGLTYIPESTYLIWSDRERNTLTVARQE